MAGAQQGFNGSDLAFFEAVGPWEVWGRGDMVDVVMLEELCKLIRSKWGNVVSVEETRWSLLQYELNQVFEQGLGRFNRTLNRKGYLLKRLHTNKYSLPLSVR